MNELGRARWLCLLLLGTWRSAASAAPTAKHGPGRCAMRGQCGSEGFFGGELPCPDNGLAETPTDKAREKLVNICGTRWQTGKVCCDEDQLDVLSSNLKQADKFIFSCPACRENFYNLFCTFTCSPDQSLFVNITDTGTSRTDQTIVTELDNLWAPAYGQAFFDSCKDVQVPALGNKAMDVIGGGATNYSQFLTYLGEKKFLGSPFQINFPDPTGREKYGMQASNPKSRSCNDQDERYRCACVDCPDVCPSLSAVPDDDDCYVGYLPCLSFASMITLAAFVLALAVSIGGRVIYKNHTLRQQERLRLLQDTNASDGEDEAEEVYNAGLLDRPQRDYRLNSICDTAFARLGGACARYPFFTIGTSLLVVALLSLGWINFQVERDPVNLWVSPSSAAYQEKRFFDTNFGPFYRAEQVFLVNDSQSSRPSPVLSYSTLEWWFEVEKRIRESKLNGVSLDDVCFNPTGEACVIQSVTGYFKGDFNRLKPKTWQSDIRKCAQDPTQCLPPYGAPQYKNQLFGAWDDTEDVLTSQAMVVTWVVNNYAKNSPEEAPATQWEAGLRDLLNKASAEAQERGLRLSFSTEISLEEELNQSANTDASIVVLSYIIMFVYASFALGSATLSAQTILKAPLLAMIHSKFALGISGIIIVLLSVSASVGLFSAIGIKVTLIIAEVIPFLVLAVGVDNIFLIVHEFERINQNYAEEEIDSRIAKALGRMGPSILLSALTETIAFVLGVFVGMPAVRNFAAYAAGAVFINAILQVTMFVAVLAINQKRVESNRIDCFPFIKVKSGSIARGTYTDESDGPLQQFLRRSYAPTLLAPKTKVAVVGLFAAAFAAGVALIPYISLGLDQRLAIPNGSYLIDYFNDVYRYMNVGPPVYFVSRSTDATARSNQEALCGRFTNCNDYSIPTTLSLEAQRSEVSFITGSSASWIDDFFLWLNPGFEECCQENGEVCFKERDPAWNITLSGMPVDDEFIYWLNKWLHAPSTAECPIGGKAAYSTAVVVDEKNKSVPTSHFRTSHTPLRSQSDFIDAYASARRIADEISESEGIDVFPYSIFYIFFDQYASIASLAATLLATAGALILLVTSVLLGSFATGAVVTLTVAMIVVDILGTMAIAGVSLNALSLVNLVISVGIGVEFCAHIARAFMFPSRPILEQAKVKYRGRDARVWAALVNVGGSVFSGITITKLLGVCVLAFTKSKIFEVYYFRIWLALVIWAALHALVFLPVALSVVGGDGYVDPESEGGLNGDLSSRRYRALIADDDDSDDEY